ncbi:ABC transporter ATP-binding protein [Pseudorhizobium sp. NPDC055634]
MDTYLDVQNLSLSFGGLKVTNDVSLTLKTGSRTALIGPNGAGKTTLINLIAGSYRPHAGQIHLMGQDVTSLSDTERVRLGLIRSFQITRLFPDMSVLDHVALAVLQRDGKTSGMFRSYHGMPDVVAEAMQTLEKLRLGSLANHQVALIAYGQQRLLEIAIALVLKPKVLLLDEPGAGIPSSDMDRVVATLDELPPDLAVLLIDHDMDLIRKFARDVIVLSAGTVIFRGTPDKLAVDENVRKAYLGDEI